MPTPGRKDGPWGGRVRPGCKMARGRRYVSCPSFPKGAPSYFLGILLNKFGHRVASARKVGLFEIAKPLAARMLRVKSAKNVRHLAKWS